MGMMLRTCWSTLKFRFLTRIAASAMHLSRARGDSGATTPRYVMGALARHPATTGHT
jgi:hypothetical protein